MKFVFIENRYKTFFWDAVADRLAETGHEISWLVQNPIFLPKTGVVEVIRFPRKGDMAKRERTPSLDFIRRSDRNVNYFGGDDRHYRYYQMAIQYWLEAQAPDAVIGESTLFHELMAVDWCKRRHVPFLHPIMIGYPGGRFTVYSGDSKEPVGFRSAAPDDQECLAIAEAIRLRQRVPDYMRAPDATDPLRVQPAPRSIHDRTTILRGYLKGERFNTPAPQVKWRLDRSVRKMLGEWSVIARSKAGDEAGKRVALYPLQMQPEANLDVWGQTFRDQAAVIAGLADALPPGWHLMVKANPKAKYELTPALMEVFRRRRNVSPVPLESGMDTAMQRADLVCTVTGTVAVECVMSGKPLAQLGPSIVKNGAGCVQLSQVADIANVAAMVEQGAYPLAKDSDRVALVRELFASTYPGIVADPASMPAVMQPENTRRVAEVLLRVATQ